MYRDDEPTRRHHPDDGRASALAARKEVVEILADALWSLICVGHGPRSPRGQSRDDIAAQHAEITGV